MPDQNDDAPHCATCHQPLGYRESEKRWRCEPCRNMRRNYLRGHPGLHVSDPIDIMIPYKDSHGITRWKPHDESK